VRATSSRDHQLIRRFLSLSVFSEAEGQLGLFTARTTARFRHGRRGQGTYLILFICTVFGTLGIFLIAGNARINGELDHLALVASRKTLFRPWLLFHRPFCAARFPRSLRKKHMHLEPMLFSDPFNVRFHH